MTSFLSLTSKQRKIVHKILELNKNVFITGSAGVGKSFLLKFLIKSLQCKFPEIGQVAVTATTGIAATHINGQTLHSFSGIRIGKGTAIELLQQMSKEDIKRWKIVKCLIIDEVSMLDGDTFDKLDFIAKSVKKNQQPFGGVQLVLSGDFFQLPPVQGVNKRPDNLFTFESISWNEAKISFTELTQVIRQSGVENARFVEILNDIRKGNISSQGLDEINQCHVSVKPIPSDGILPTKLYCTNKDVDKENKRFLWQLPGRQVEYEGLDAWGKVIIPTKQAEMISMMDKLLPKILKLKKGAQVILTRNISNLGLVNGSRGVVETFETNQDNSTQVLPVVRFDNNVVVPVTYFEEVYNIGPCYLTRKQIPLKLAWALTVHKSQGMTVSRVELSLSNAFDFGQVYVALSRVASIKGLYLSTYLTAKNIKVHPNVCQYYATNCELGCEDTHVVNDAITTSQNTILKCESFDALSSLLYDQTDEKSEKYEKNGRVFQSVGIKRKLTFDDENDAQSDELESEDSHLMNSAQTDKISESDEENVRVYRKLIKKGKKVIDDEDDDINEKN